MKTIYIKSTFSEIDELDGLYKVSIPKEYENNYQDIIENVSSMLDIIQANNYPSNLEELKEELEESEYNEISKEFMINNFDVLYDFAEQGSTLSRTLYCLEKIGFEWEEIYFLEIYNADYGKFNKN